MTQPTDPEVAEAPDDEGVIGALGAQGLADCAERLAEIGRGAHNRFGDRISALAATVADLAAEAHQRLSEDRLPDETGADEQRARIAAEHERRQAEADQPPAGTEPEPGVSPEPEPF